MSRKLAAVLVGMLVLALGAGGLLSQEAEQQRPRREGTRAERRERMERRAQERQEQMKESLQIESEEQWDKVWPLIQDIQTYEFTQRFAAARSRRGREAGPGAAAQRTGAFGFRTQEGEPPAELTALSQATQELADVQADAAATDDKITEAINAYTKAREAFEGLIEKKQKALRETVGPRQEAGLLLLGVL